MAPGFLTGDGGNEILGFDRRLVMVVAIVGIVAAGGAAATMFLGGGDSTESNAQLDSVPGDVDGLIYIDGNVTEDQLTLDSLDGGLEVGWWFVDNSEAPDISVLLDTLDTENINYKNTTVFLRGPENGSADYAGSVVNFGEGSSASDMIELLETELGEDQFEQTSYNGVDVREVNLVEAAENAEVEGVTDELDVTGIIREFVGVDTTAWVATPDEDTVILGSEAAASDAIDVRQGESEPIGGEMRDSHEVADPGPVEATVSPDIIDEPIKDVVGIISNEAAALLDITGHTPEYLSASYEVRNREREIMTFDMTISMADSAAAGDMIGALKSRYENSSVAMEGRQNIREATAIERSAGEKNGRYLHLEIPTLPIQTETYVAQFVDAYGADPDPVNLVPAAADGVLSIDGNATGDETTTGIADSAFAEGLVAGAEDTTVAEVLDHINAANVDYRSMTTFYSEDDEDYVGTYVELDRDPNEFIESEIRGQYRQATGGEEMSFREHEEGYNHVDVYNLSDLGAEQELNITRALSGFIADGTTDWAAPVSDNSLVFGDKQAVQDVADIYRGEAGPAETPLHEAHNRTEGQIALSGNVSEKPVAGYAGAIDGELGDALSGQDSQVLSVAYTVGGSSDVSLDVQFRAPDEGAAGDLSDALNGAVEDTGGDAVHQRASVSQNGVYVHLTVPYGSDQLVDDLSAFVDAYGTGPFPEGGS
jgi:hypothetical protein